MGRPDCGATMVTGENSATDKVNTFFFREATEAHFRSYSEPQIRHSSESKGLEVGYRATSAENTLLLSLI